MRQITSTNARTQSIEFAIQELSHSETEPTMLAVREFMDEFTQTKIPTGKKKTYTDPNGEEVEYEEKVPISKVYNYIRDEKEILSESRAAWLNEDSHFLSNIQPFGFRLSEALRELKRVGWTVRADSVTEFTRQVFNILDYIQTGTRHQENLYIHSSVEGNGKSTLKNKLMRAFESTGAKVDSASWPTGSYSDTTPFSRNAVIGIDDTGWSTIKDINEDQIKAILRRENSPTLSCNIKYNPTMMLKPRAVVVACGNVKPPKADDRTWRVVETNSITVETARNDIRLRDVLEDSLDTELVTLQQVTASSKILRQFFNNLNEKNEERNGRGSAQLALESEYLSSVVDLLCYIQKYRTAAIDFTRCSLSDFFKCDENLSKEMKYRLTVVYSKTLKYLYSKGYCKRLTYGDDLYAKFNISSLMDIDVETLATQESVEITAVDEVLRTLEKWDELITLAEQLESENPDDDPQPSKDEKEDTIEVEEGSPIEVEEGSPIEDINDLLKKEEDMAVVGVKKVNYKVDSEIKRTKNGYKTLVLTFTEMTTKEKHAKYYFCYNDKGQAIQNGASLQFSKDVQQIWYSRGRGLDDPIEWSQFTERMLDVLRGKQQLHINAYLSLEFERKNPYYVQNVGLPEDYEINKEVR